MSRPLRPAPAGRLALTALLVGALTGCGSTGNTGQDVPAAPHTQNVATPSPSATGVSPPASSLPAAPTSHSSGPDSAAAAAGRIQDPTAEVGPPPPAAAPTRVQIPAIGVDAPLEILSVDADDVLQPPVDWDAAGWYERSPVPGDRGPAVIAGHLVGPSEAAVFADLGALVRGDLVTVDRADGTRATFTVNRIISAERTETFPTSEIYGPTPDAQLRLITCDGEYDPSRGHWTRNMVVFASQVAS